MGQLATQAQNAQMQTMNPQKNMKSLLERSWPRIAAVIGNNLSPQRLYQMYVSTINREPQLANCGVESVLSCFMKCAALGLEPSNVDGLGRAYILPYGNKNYRTGQKEATLIIGYKGMIDLARRSGQIRDISARAVHEGDEFTYSYGLNEDLRHVPCAKPGKLTHVYMIANFKDGGHYFQVMTADEIAATLVSRLTDDLPLQPGDEVSVMVNGLGATPLEEQLIVFRRVKQRLDALDVESVMPHVGNFATSMEMAGLSITVMKLDDELEALLRAPASTPFYTNANK